MSYKYNGNSVNPPPGTIAQYMGNTDPDGWLICDGVQRIVTDGRFQALNAIITPGGGDSNRCTPPNLKGKFLYGSSSVSIGTTGGSETKAIGIDNLPSHNHVVTDNGHTHGTSSSSHSHTISGTEHSHGITDPGHTHTHDTLSWDAVQSGSATACWAGHKTVNTGKSYTSISINSAASGGTISSETVSIVSNSATTGITVGNTGSGTALNIMPPYFVINHIIKY
jgi:microcystin-dependent protein